MLLFSIIAKNLLWALQYPRFTPQLEGNYEVGAIQYRIPGCTSCQIHYPCCDDNITTMTKKKKKKTTRRKFYPYFRKSAINGLSNYIKGGETSSTSDSSTSSKSEILNFLFDKCHPCHIGAEPFVPSTNTTKTSNNRHNTKEGERNNDSDSDNNDTTQTVTKYPVVIFSHGLGGCMEMYTQLCQQIASFGYCVIAMEHEDGSGSYAERKKSDSSIYDKNNNDKSNSMRSSSMPIRYKRPDDTPYSRNKVLNFRTPMLQHRVDEVEQLIDYIMTAATTTTATTSGSIKYDYDNINNQGEKHEAKIFSKLLQLFDTTKGIALIGHSFGASTMALVAQHYYENKKFTSSTTPMPMPKTTSTSTSTTTADDMMDNTNDNNNDGTNGIINSVTMLDPWEFALDDISLQKGLSYPTLSIMSEFWTMSKETQYAIQLLQNSKKGKQHHNDDDYSNNNDESIVSSYYIPNSVHQSFSDITSWLPGLIAKKMYIRGKKENRHDTIRTVANAFDIHYSHHCRLRPRRHRDIEDEERAINNNNNNNNKNKNNNNNHSLLRPFAISPSTINNNQKVLKEKVYS